MNRFEKSPSIYMVEGLARVKPFPIQIFHLSSNLVILHTHLPMKMEQMECSETSARTIQMPGNYPKESIQQGSHDNEYQGSRTVGCDDT